jgi:hypothetical protein
MADDVTFYFDPSCPFTWQTSRWLCEVTEPRGHTIAYRLMSLAILNEGKTIPDQYREQVDASMRPVRVMFATLQQHGNDAVGTLYREFGSRFFDGASIDDALAGALKAASLPAGLADAATDESLDAPIHASHDEGQRRVGEEAGSPITCVGDGPGFFGPVVVPVPEGEAAEKLYDAVRLLSAVPEFSELKRARAEL